MRIDIRANRQSLRRFYAVARDVVESTAAFKLLAEALCDSFRLCGIRKCPASMGDDLFRNANSSSLRDQLEFGTGAWRKVE